MIKKIIARIVVIVACFILAITTFGSFIKYMSELSEIGIDINLGITIGVLSDYVIPGLGYLFIALFTLLQRKRAVTIGVIILAASFVIMLFRNVIAIGTALSYDDERIALNICANGYTILVNIISLAGLIITIILMHVPYKNKFYKNALFNLKVLLIDGIIPIVALLILGIYNYIIIKTVGDITFNIMSSYIHIKAIYTLGYFLVCGRMMEKEE